jgi:hypothetical protein
VISVGMSSWHAEKAGISHAREQGHLALPPP